MSRLRELLAKAKETVRLHEQRREVQGRLRDIALDVDLDPARRGQNLRLLRWYFQNEHQEPFVRMLGIGSQSRYSAIENGRLTLDNKEARTIESELDLPLGWLDRDNSEAILLSNDEWQLIHALRKSIPEVAASLISTVTNIRVGRDGHA